MNKKKLFISLPMTNMEDTVLKRYREALSIIEKDENLSSYEVVTPYGMFHAFDENGLKEGIDDSLPSIGYYMGKDVELVINCNAIYSCEGWSKSKGCKVERATAEIYGLELYGCKE